MATQSEILDLVKAHGTPKTLRQSIFNPVIEMQSLPVTPETVDILRESVLDYLAQCFMKSMLSGETIEQLWAQIKVDEHGPL